MSTNIPSPLFAELAADYEKATEPWRERGFDIESKADFAARVKHCEPCDWKMEDREGRPTCEHPERNCRKLLPFLSGQLCPLQRWKEKD